MSRDDSTLYVSNEGSNTVTVIDLAPWGRISRLVGLAGASTIDVGKRPGAMALWHDGNRLFVGNRGGAEFRQGQTIVFESTVSVIDTASKRVVATIPLGGKIIDVAVTPDGKKLYVATGSPGKQGVARISLSDGYPVGWISEIPCPMAVAITPDGQRLYVNYQCAPYTGTAGHDPIVVYDADTDSPVPLAIVYGWRDGTPMANVGGPLAMSPDGRQVWAAANDACARRDAYGVKGCPGVGPNDDSAFYTPRGVINVVGTANNGVIDQVAVIGYDPRGNVIGAHRPVFSPDGRHVAVITGIDIRYHGAGNPGGSGNRDLERIIPTTTRASDVAIAGDGNRLYAVLPQEDSLQPIDLVAPTLTPLALAAAIGASMLLAAVIFWIASWRLQRYLRIIRGQRWIFSTGHCDYKVEVTAAGLNVYALAGHAGTRVPRIAVPGAGWSSDVGKLREQLQALRGELRPRVRVRIETERSVFDRPWAYAIGDPWSTVDGRIAGQISFTSDFPTADRHRLRKLVFSGLRCARGTRARDDLELAWVAAEIASVSRVFAGWGAQTRVLEADATTSDFIAALKVSDVVHAAVHATADGLDLRDGILRADMLGGEPVRCRLLVLSACDAADIRMPDAFLWAALGRGINVIAAMAPVNDFVCSVFFPQLYSALLPRRQFGGISLAEAIARGAASNQRNFQAMAERTGNRDAASRWQQTVDSFVLYGDPSLSLQLRR